MNTFSPFPLSLLPYLGPELVLLSVGILLIGVDLFCKNRLLLPWLTAAGTLGALVLLFNSPSGVKFYLTEVGRKYCLSKEFNCD